MTAHAVQLTPQGMGAIAVILLAGEGSRGVLQKLLPENATLPAINKTRRINLLNAQREPLDDALLLCTAADRYELHTHGGTAVVAAILHALQYAGAQIVSLPDAIALKLLGPTLHSEILESLSLATTLTAAQLLAAQSAQGLTQWATHWQQRLPTTPLWQLHSAAQWLLTRSNTLNRLLHPARIAIIGPPNAGKSTLANALLGRPIAITSDTPGTTRDWVDARATLTHKNIAVPVTLVDTAGIHETTDPLEQLAIARTHDQATQADLLLVLYDAGQPLPVEHFFNTATMQPSLLVANKIDTVPNPALPKNFLHISAKTHLHLDTLMSALLTKLDLATINPTEPFAFTPRQVAILQTLSLTTDTHIAKSLLTALTA